MIELDIPGFGKLALQHLVLDYNGTLALDGRIQPGVQSRLTQLGGTLHIHILTADTFGTVRSTFGTGGHDVHILPPGDERTAKADFVRGLGAQACACMVLSTRLSPDPKEKFALAVERSIEQQKAWARSTTRSASSPVKSGTTSSPSI